MFDTDIALYGIFISISIILGLFLVYYNSKNIKLRKEYTNILLLYIIIGSVFGAKYYTYFTNYEKFGGVFDFFKLGLSSYGAVIGILLMLIVFSVQFKIKYKDLIYLITPSVPLMYGVGKIGCFLAGCCYGIEYSGPFSIVYNVHKGISFFPIQLVEAIVFIIIFLFVFLLIKKKVSHNKIIAITFIMCGISKFLLEYLRFGHINILISINQIFSIIFVIVGLFIIIYEAKFKIN